MALQPCPETESLDSYEINQFKLKALGWKHTAEMCKQKHDILRDCVKDYQDQ